MNTSNVDTTKIDNKSISDTLPIPLEKIPEWNQEERMRALFSPFRSRSANSQDWISKYKFWHNLIYEWLKHTMQCSFSIADLSEVFKRKGCAPLCLATVIEELLRNNEIIQETDFFKEPCETWTAWSIDTFVRRPVNWSFTKMKTYVIGPKINNTESRYIHMQIVQELGDIILSIAEIKKDVVLYSICEIVEYCKSKTKKQVSEDTVRLVLEWLKRERKVAFKKASNLDSELLVKICVQTATEITEEEEGLYILLKQESKLIKEIELMEQEKLKIIDEVKSHLAKELRQMAKMHLKKKHKLENTIEKRIQALANLRVIITNIEDARYNSSVLSAYKTGSNILKKMGKDSFMEYETVVDVMDNINELLEENKERNSVLSETLNNTDEAELEEELAELMKENEFSPTSDDYLQFPTVSESNSELEQLEQRLNDLGIKSPVSSDKNITTLPSVPSHKGKASKESEYL